MIPPPGNAPAPGSRSASALAIACAKSFPPHPKLPHSHIPALKLQQNRLSRQPASVYGRPCISLSHAHARQTKIPGAIPNTPYAPPPTALPASPPQSPPRAAPAFKKRKTSLPASAPATKPTAADPPPAPTGCPKRRASHSRPLNRQPCVVSQNLISQPNLLPVKGFLPLIPGIGKRNCFLRRLRPLPCANPVDGRQ